MKYITQSVLALMLGLTLAACGPAKDQKPVTEQQQPAQQTAEAAPTKKAYFPEFDASLLEPINISDQKSKTAIADYEKYAAVMQKLEPEVVKATNKLMQEARKQGKEPSAEFKQMLQQWSDVYAQGVQTLSALDLKDAEVKALAERHIKLMQKQKDLAMVAINDAISLESASEKVKQDFKNQSAEQKQKLKQAMDVFGTAMKKFTEKYSG